MPASGNGDVFCVMPITARLSRRFYETFGDEIVNELVEWLNQVDLAFRSELRDAHELGLQRLEAKVDQRFAELRAELKDDLAALRVERKEGLAALRAELKDDLAALRAEMKEGLASLRAEQKDDLASLRAEQKDDLASLRAEQKDDIRSLQISMRDLRAELIKWMFLFWVGTVGLTLATRFLK